MLLCEPLFQKAFYPPVFNFNFIALPKLGTGILVKRNYNWVALKLHNLLKTSGHISLECQRSEWPLTRDVYPFELQQDTKGHAIEVDQKQIFKGTRKCGRFYLSTTFVQCYIDVGVELCSFSLSKRESELAFIRTMLWCNNLR